MPVGKFAGQKKSMSIEDAERIISIHGEYAPSGIGEIDVSDLQAKIGELEKELVAEKARVDELEKLLEEASTPDGGEGGAEDE